jgi:hypothetical protein
MFSRLRVRFNVNNLLLFNLNHIERRRRAGCQERWEQIRDFAPAWSDALVEAFLNAGADAGAKRKIEICCRSVRN